MASARARGHDDPVVHSPGCGEEGEFLATNTRISINPAYFKKDLEFDQFVDLLTTLEHEGTHGESGLFGNLINVLAKGHYRGIGSVEWNSLEFVQNTFLTDWGNSFNTQTELLEHLYGPNWSYDSPYED